jgi:hypothetical protein
MAVNSDKAELWEEDIKSSVAMYNKWYMRFAPGAFQSARKAAEAPIKTALKITNNLCDITPKLLWDNPRLIAILRMLTAPPTARERLAGLAGVPLPMLVKMEKTGHVPQRMKRDTGEAHLEKVCKIIEQLADADLFGWLHEKRKPTEDELRRATYIVSERHSGAAADPIIRNEQEARQVKVMLSWLKPRGYKPYGAGTGVTCESMTAGTCGRLILRVPLGSKDAKEAAEEAGLVVEDEGSVNIPIDLAVMPLKAKKGDLPLLIEAKSAGDFTNVNKRRKEEKTKIDLLKSHYGKDVPYILFLCGYFGKKYLSYEATAGIDWVWEHRVDDLAKFRL